MIAKHDPITLTLALLTKLREATGNAAMPVQQVHLFLHVAQQGEVRMGDLEVVTGVRQSSVSRNVASLGEGWPNEPGYGLLEAYEEPFYRRRKLVRLTPKGAALARSLSQTLKAEQEPPVSSSRPINQHSPSMSQSEGEPLSNRKSFDFEGCAKVTTLERNGEVWFVAADVCDALEIRNHSDAVSRLDEEERGVGITDTLGGRQQVIIINESGLYSLIFRSRKESAKRFKKWVTSVVLPSIRIHGGYIKGVEGLDQENQALTVQAIHKEAERVGVCAAEEREARRNGFRALKGKPPIYTVNTD